MAEFKEVIKQFNRMCESYGASCDGCPVDEQRGIFYCWRWITEEPEVAEELIANWAKDHPTKKNYQKFEETFGINPILMDWWNTRGADWLMEEFKEPKKDE